MTNKEELYGNIYEKGAEIFRQGDPGDTMYVIQYGAVEVIQKNAGKENVLALLEKGDFFGEMALIDNQPRSASIRTLCRSRLLELSRSSLLSRLKNDPGIALNLLKILSKRIENSNLSRHKSINIEQSFSEDELISDNNVPSTSREKINTQQDRLNILRNQFMDQLTDITDEAEHRHLKAGETVFKSNESGDEMYIISEGQIEISQSALENKYILAYLGPGDFFGEMSLITNRPRTATAAAGEDTDVMVFSRRNFLDGLSRKPELGLLVLQLMIIRLRHSFLAVTDRDKGDDQKTDHAPALLKKEDKININLVTLAACSGCAEGLLQDVTELNKLLELANIAYSTLLTDQETIGYADITIVDGSVRTKEEEEKLYEVRDKSRLIVAWGTCAAYGGIPAYANKYDLEELFEEAYGQAMDPFSYYLKGSRDIEPVSYQQSDLELLRKAGKVDDFIKVDYYLPGCPPHISLLTKLAAELSGQVSIEKTAPIVCAECSRKPFKCPDSYSSHYPGKDCDENICLNAQGVICMGFLTRGGCRGACPKGGLPCWSCRGPSDITLKKIINGDSLEMILIDSLTKRCKISSDKIEPLVKALYREGNSMLRFDHYFTHNKERIR